MLQIGYGGSFQLNYRLLDGLAVGCWLRVREVPGSIPSQGPRHTKDVIQMVTVVPLFRTEHTKDRKSFEVRGRCGGDEKIE